MKILHLFSDWKWTGPAEPVLNLCRELERRGHEITLAYRKPPLGAEESFQRQIKAAGIRATDQFHLNHVLKVTEPSFLVHTLWDLRRLSDYLRRERFEIVNVHHSHDHILGGWVAKRLFDPPVVIRTDHKRDGIKPSPANRFLISRFTDGILTFSEKVKRDDMKHFNLPAERVAKVVPALDLSRYDPSRGYRDMRSIFGIDPEELIVGLVARFQKYRRTDVFLEAMRSVVDQFRGVKVLLVGRSGQMEESVIRPMKRLGLEPWVVLAGYRTEDYLDTLACMDIFVFLMPGSDGTARALREAMAMAKPVVVADRGILPELVEDGVSGVVVNDRPKDMAAAILRLLRDPKLRESMGSAAWERAHAEFRLDRQGEAVEAFYRQIKALGKWKKK